jgi:hypothetical protein
VIMAQDYQVGGISPVIHLNPSLSGRADPVIS